MSTVIEPYLESLKSSSFVDGSILLKLVLLNGLDIEWGIHVGVKNGETAYRQEDLDLASRPPGKALDRDKGRALDRDKNRLADPDHNPNLQLIKDFGCGIRFMDEILSLLLCPVHVPYRLLF